MGFIHAIVELNPESKLVLISLATFGGSLSLTSIERIHDINLQNYRKILVASVDKNFFNCSESVVVLLTFN